jgi:hypothetical protein
MRKKTGGRNKTELLIKSGMGAESVMGQMGAAIRGDVQDKIVSLMTPANSAATVKRKGFNNPLIDTGHMLKSVSFKTKATA